VKSGSPSEDLDAELTEIAALKERLIAGLPGEETEWSTYDVALSNPFRCMLTKLVVR